MKTQLPAETLAGIAGRFKNEMVPSQPPQVLQEIERLCCARGKRTYPPAFTTFSPENRISTCTADYLLQSAV
jgi:hypothetical protein